MVLLLVPGWRPDLPKEGAGRPECDGGHEPRQNRRRSTTPYTSPGLAVARTRARRGIMGRLVRRQLVLRNSAEKADPACMCT